MRLAIRSVTTSPPGIRAVLHDVEDHSRIAVELDRLSALADSDLETILRDFTARRRTSPDRPGRVVLEPGQRTTATQAWSPGCTRQLLDALPDPNATIHLRNAEGSPLEQLADLRRALGAAANPRCRVALDVGAAYAAAVNPRDVLAEFAERIEVVYLSDRKGRTPVPLGTGRVNLPGLMSDLRGMDYHGWVVVAPPGTDGNVAEAQLGRELDTARLLLAGKR